MRKIRWILAAAAAPVVRGFLLLPTPKCHNLIVFASEEEPNGADGGGKQEVCVKRRSSDFPPSLFFGEDPQTKRNNKNIFGFDLNVQFFESGVKERVYSSNRTSTVSIPSNREFANEALVDGSLKTVEKSALRTRLLNERFYASKTAFELKNMHTAPGLSDLVTTERTGFLRLDKLWITLPARLLTFTSACFCFPYIMSLLDRFVTMPPDLLTDIARSFGPGIAILYGTFTSLTISILYQRIRNIQENIATEASLIVFMLRTVLSLFRDEDALTLEAGQAVADQIRTLVKSGRGVELMLIMYADPYARLLELVDHYDYDMDAPRRERKGSLIAICRDTLKDLTRVRSIRLAEEARALPPTHFLVLNVLTSFILLSYCINVLPSLDALGGVPASESLLIFGLLTTVYVLFYNFAADLNNPFGGVYQVRRSTAASHLLEAKWLIVNHPVLRDKVDFEEAQEQPDGVWVHTPGLGDCLFQKDDLYLGGKQQQQQ